MTPGKPGAYWVGTSTAQITPGATRRRPLFNQPHLLVTLILSFLISDVVPPYTSSSPTEDTKYPRTQKFSAEIAAALSVLPRNLDRSLAFEVTPHMSGVRLSGRVVCYAEIVMLT